MKVISIITLFLIMSGKTMAQEPLQVTTVEHVDLNRYCGTWYEIARFPNRFQRKCACCTSAEYTLLADGKIKVVNRCLKADSSLSVTEGIAKKEDPKGSNARLKVRFAPSWLGWIPYVWGTYWIIDLAPDYSYAVVGEPSRKYLWILSRTKNIEESEYGEIISRLNGMGYDTDKLIMTDQE
jgi:apolipoprotein D and lipocalin family protein